MDTQDFEYGTLTKWVADQQYGFIKTDNGKIAFVHVGFFVDKIAPPKNTRLKFRLIQNPRRPAGQMMAQDIEVVVPRVTVAENQYVAGKHTKDGAL